jgi:hypothetical protein
MFLILFIAMDDPNLLGNLREVLHDQGHKNVEFEVRLGRVVNNMYVAGVSKAKFEHLLRMLEASPSFTKIEKTTLEKLNGSDARFIIENGDEASGRWCYKKKVYATLCPEKEDGLVPRASVAIEGHDHTPPKPGSAPYKYHRLKKRTSFRYKCWSVDLTRVTSNLPGQFDNDEEIYEVEIELAGTEAYFVYTLNHLVKWAIHLLNELIAL